MAKILVLSGSPRKGGNTEKLVEAFCKGAEGREVEVISVRDYKINPCLACNACIRRDGVCVQKDGMDIIYDKMKTADVLIVASPVYFYGVSAQLKAIIDRLHNPIRNTFNIKKLGLIMVGAATLPDLFDSILARQKQIMRFFNIEDAGSVLVRGVREKGDLKEDDLLNAFHFGESIQ